MQSIEAYRAGGGDDPVGWATASPKADLTQLIDLSVDTDKPILIVEDGKPVGVVTKRNLLRGIQGEKDNG